MEKGKATAQRVAAHVQQQKVEALAQQRLRPLSLEELHYIKGHRAMEGLLRESREGVQTGVRLTTDSPPPVLCVARPASTCRLTTAVLFTALSCLASGGRRIARGRCGCGGMGGYGMYCFSCARARVRCSQISSCTRGMRRAAP